MRILFALPVLALPLAACQVTEDSANDQVTIQYNQDLAENVAADITNGAEEAGEAIANGAREAGETVRNVDVDVDVDANRADNTPAGNSN